MPNVLFVHYADLKRDAPGRIRALAQFLGIAIDEAEWPRLLEYCSFPWMKANAIKSVPLGGAFWDAGAQVFINKGVNGRWRDTLSAADIAAYDSCALQEPGADCARWLANGEMCD